VPTEKGEKKVDYAAFIVIGITFIGVGTALGVSSGPGLYGLAVLGIVSLVIGLANREKSFNSIDS
jgi:hypothetical protein